VTVAESKHLKKEGMRPENLVQALKTTQQVEGHVSPESARAIAQQLRVPYSEVFSVATFYHLLSTEPLGKYRIYVCTGITCYIKGNTENLKYLKSVLGIKDGHHTSSDGLFTVEEVSCLSCCSHAPVVAVHMPDGTKRIVGRANPEVLQKMISELRLLAHKKGWVK